MGGVKVMLFGIAVILFSGFIVVGQAAGYAYNSLFFWGMILGLAITFVGLAMNDSDEWDENHRSDGNERDDGSGTDDENESNDEGKADDENGSGDEDDTDSEAVGDDQHYVQINRFPPM